MKKPWQKTSSMEGSFARKPILSETNSRITLSNENATDDTDKIDMPRFSLKQKFAALAVLLAGMNGFAYCHNTAEAPVSSETAATAEPFGQSGRDVEFTTPDGEIDVKKVDREVLHGITTRYTELQGKTKTDRYTGDSLTARQTDKSRGIEKIITAKRAIVDRGGQNVVVTTVAHKQKRHNHWQDNHPRGGDAGDAARARGRPASWRANDGRAAADHRQPRHRSCSSKQLLSKCQY